MQIDREVRELEEGMWRPSTRANREWMERHLSSDFVEFGRSGRRYTRQEIIDVHVPDFVAVIPLKDLAMRRLGDELVLVTYQSEMDGLRANRASIWRRAQDRWLMEFHQGTPIA